MQNDFLNAVDFSHYLLAKTVKKGDVVLDATAGNGHDSKFLAELVGTKGKLYAIDIQQQAVDNTLKLLKKDSLFKQAELINSDHAELDKYIEESLKAVIFNLGYLPGGDKEIITKSESTIKALNKALKILEVKGIIILVVYTGHEGGKEERDVLLKYSTDLDYKKYNVLNYKFLNQPGPPPEIIAIKKRK
ncbi:Putative rRNA methylase [Halanaerobium congolense]|jgi:ubiquinone/menaquinone biosynthesis C-methylase UbiE|uniref:Putative rRNA methylase n=1 Tax=Halanaerobium congolense TaxID=54121 RepID=A0A1M7GNI1_9FIRM|nr:class I SAM-dependent methyltransferase [Halanaerobium congolense]KXS50337.1 MAG: rRNA methylase [Halanaerobium sp. T82-1]PUU91951.1 MAG: rRNA methylase [Halanaerobium sp.]TDP11535.1 putative rRNA methylase [Halanaerobium congolense]SDG83215.1 Putative rRNA methylase [Halanaerobium congolense]SDI49258.1 Putative rRNA methylase [Halanaerobium congolense]